MSRIGATAMPKLIVGLGNPGARYANTRHNIGWVILDAFLKKHGVLLDRNGHHGQYGEMRWKETGNRVILLKPMTFMNLSGRSVAPASHFYRVDTADLLVIFDDLDLPPGRLRMREKGSAGGHNGMKSIIQELGTDQFPRLKIGIGRPAPGWEVPDWVLSVFGPEDASLVVQAVPRAVEAVEAFLTHGTAKAMTRYNG